MPSDDKNLAFKKQQSKKTLVGLIAILTITFVCFLILKRRVTPVALTLQIVGSVLYFVGNLLVTDSVRRYNASALWQWKVGNPIQTTGFLMMLYAGYLLASK